MTRDDKIKLFRENCFAPKEALDVCFEKHGDEIIEGHYIPLGMPQGVYESLVKQVRAISEDAANSLDLFAKWLFKNYKIDLKGFIKQYRTGSKSYIYSDAVDE